VSKYTSTTWLSNSQVITSTLRTYPQYSLHYDSITSDSTLKNLFSTSIVANSLLHANTTRHRSKPQKCNAIIEIRSPNNIKEEQRLISRLTTISRFLPKLAEQTHPIIQLLKKSKKFSWNDECEQVFQNLKTSLTSPPILHKPNIHQTLLVYITATNHTVSIALI